jgi:hypothetical protein
MTFRDFCASFYDRAERTNTAYEGMPHKLSELTPQGANVFPLCTLSFDLDGEWHEETTGNMSGAEIKEISIRNGHGKRPAVLGGQKVIPRVCEVVERI